MFPHSHIKGLTWQESVEEALARLLGRHQPTFGNDGVTHAHLPKDELPMPEQGSLSIGHQGLADE